MSDKSKIEWTEATWNPVTGCNKVSAGCKNCYAERVWKRLSANSTSVYFGRQFNDVQMHDKRLTTPLKWSKPRLIFVNSMSDLFHDKVSASFIHEVFVTMAFARARGHVFQILTKRPERMKEIVSQLDVDDIKGRYHGAPVNMPEFVWPLPNVWLGVSVEDHHTALVRIPFLLQTPAAIRWISAEPLLESLDLSAPGLGLNCESCIDRQVHWCCDPVLDWVVAGGESGPNARPSHPDWFRGLRDACQEARVPFFFKQWGEWEPFTSVSQPFMEDTKGFLHDAHGLDIIDPDTGDLGKQWKWDYLDTVVYRNVGKKKAGRLLDGKTWDEMPEAK